MGNLRVSNSVVLAKIESTYNTDSVPVVGTNAILVQNASFALEGLRMNDRPAIKGSLGKLQQVYGGTLGKLSFEVEVKGSGTAGTAPEVDPLLLASSMAKTIVASTSVTYKPTSTTQDSVTIYWYEGGRKLHKLTGAVGTCECRISAGGIAVLAFEFTGHYTRPTDASQPSPTYSSVVPAAAVGMTWTVGGVSVIAREFNVSLNNVIAMPGNLSAADGYSQIQVTGRDVAGSITLESELAATIDVDTQLSSGTGSTLATGTLGGTAGNRFAVASATNGLYWRTTEFTDGDGLALRTMPFGLKESASLNDEVSFIYT